MMFWTPKCACTTSHLWFFRTLGLEDQILMLPGVDTGEKIHKFRDTVFYNNFFSIQNSPKILSIFKKKKLDPRHRLTRLYRDDGYFKFVIIRNPYSRVVSSYLNLGSILLHNLATHDIVSTFKWIDNSHAFSFSFFLDCLSQFDLYTCNAHWRYQVANDCWGSGFKIDFIIKTENLEQGFNMLNRKFDLNIPIESHYVLPQKRSYKRANSFADCNYEELENIMVTTGFYPDYKDFYTSATQKKVAKIYQPDLEALGYTFNDFFYS